MERNALVGQSGDSTAVINANPYGAIAEGVVRPEEIDHAHGMVNGIKSFLSGHVVDLSSLTHEDLILLKQTPAAYLGSRRFKLPESLDAPVYSLLSEKFKSMNIGTCLYIGGNDSMDMIDKLSRCARIRYESISFIRVPKTIDNDLPATDHTPGCGSTTKCVTSMVREISLDAPTYQQPAITIVELMGRHTGWVTATAASARKFPGNNPLLIYMPEVPLSMGQFSKDVEQTPSRQLNVVICVSEDICGRSGRFICEYTNDAQIDTFGHRMPTGYTKILESHVCDRFQVKTRSVELDVNQRCNSPLASTTDMQEAESSGGTAIEKALQGEIGKMIACFHLPGSGHEPEYGLIEIGNVYNREKPFLVEWIMAEGSDIGPEFLNYALPLTQGQPDHIMESELPKYLCKK